MLTKNTSEKQNNQLKNNTLTPMISIDNIYPHHAEKSGLKPYF